MLCDEASSVMKRIQPSERRQGGSHLQECWCFVLSIVMPPLPPPPPN